MAMRLLIHIFKDCELARLLWFHVLGIRSPDWQINDPHSLISLIFTWANSNVINNDYFLLLSMLIMESIWFYKNKCRFGALQLILLTWLRM